MWGSQATRRCGCGCASNPAPRQTSATVTETRTATGARYLDRNRASASNGTATNASPKPNAERMTVARNSNRCHFDGDHERSASAVERDQIRARRFDSRLPQHGGDLAPMITAVIHQVQHELPMRQHKLRALTIAKNQRLRTNPRRKGVATNRSMPYARRAMPARERSDPWAFQDRRVSSPFAPGRA